VLVFFEMQLSYFWSKVASLFSSSSLTAILPLLLEFLHFSVDISGDGATIGAGTAVGTMGDFGYVRMYTMTSDQQWVIVGNTLMAGSDGDQFGCAISFSEDASFLAVGERGHDGIPGDNSGKCGQRL